MTLDLRLPIAFRGELLAGRALYEEVIRDGILAARRSVWIATANVKELWVEPRGLRRRGRRKAGGDYVSILEPLDDLAARGVELRMLYAEIPSRRFRAAFDRRARLVKGGLAMKQCPRLHMKAVIIDGERLYLGSANLTGAGLGAKGEDARNFELGLVTDDCHLIDRVQGLFDALWRGEPCGSCRLRDVCPDPGPYAAGRRGPARSAD